MEKLSSVGKLVGGDEWSGFQCGEVQSFEDLCQAFHLVFKEYKSLGYTNAYEEQSQMRFGLYQLFSNSHTFMVKLKDVYCGTTTLIVDSDLGLPADTLFKPQLEPLRTQGRRLIEATMLTCIPCDGKKAGRISTLLIQQNFWWAMRHHIDDCVIVVNPRHVDFWHTQMGYEIYSEEKNYSHVQGAPGRLLRLDIQGLREKTKEPTLSFRQLFLDNPPKTDSAAAFRIKAQHVMKLLISNPHLILEASKKQRAILKHSFPELFQLLNFDFKNRSHRLQDKKDESLGYLAPSPQWLREHPVESQMLQI